MSHQRVKAFQMHLSLKVSKPNNKEVARKRLGFLRRCFQRDPFLIVDMPRNIHLPKDAPRPKGLCGIFSIMECITQKAWKNSRRFLLQRKISRHLPQ